MHQFTSRRDLLDEGPRSGRSSRPATGGTSGRQDRALPKDAVAAVRVARNDTPHDSIGHAVKAPSSRAFRRMRTKPGPGLCCLVLSLLLSSLACRSDSGAASPLQSVGESSRSDALMAVHASTVQRVVDNLERSSHGIFVTPAAEDIDPISVWLDIVRRVPLGRRHVLYVYDFGSWPSSFLPQSEAQGYGTDPACVIHGYSSKNGFNRARAWNSFGECMAKEGSERMWPRNGRRARNALHVRSGGA